MNDINNYQWPKDENFQKFARLVADKVTIFINNGGKIVPINNVGSGRAECNCPLGALLDNKHRYPYMYFREGWGNYSWYNLRDFIDGFDMEVRNNAYGQLGFAYRKKFGY